MSNSGFFDRIFDTQRRLAETMDALDAKSNECLNLDVQLRSAVRTIADLKAANDSFAENLDNIMPPLFINLRKDVLIALEGVPKDLSEAEANYIANILRAYAQPIVEPDAVRLFGFEPDSNVAPIKGV